MSPCSTKTPTKIEIWLIIVSTILLGVFVYSLRDLLLTPFWIFVFLLGVLFPFRSHQFVKHLMIVVGVIFSIWILKQLTGVLTPLILSFVIAYFFDPLIDRFERWRIPRTIGILIVSFFAVSILVLVVLFLIPSLLSELGQLLELVQSQYVPQLKKFVETNLLPLFSGYLKVEEIRSLLSTELPSRLQDILRKFVEGAWNITSGLTTVAGQLLNLVLIPFFTFYLLRDYDRLREWFKEHIPESVRSDLVEFYHQANPILSLFLRGQLTVCFIVGILTIIGLYIAGIPFALILGLTAGILNIVPYVGLAVSLGLALLVGLFTPAPLISILKILLIFAIVQALEGTVISPRIMGKRLGLHPAIVVLSILVFSQFFGFIGLLLAVPIAALLKVVILMQWSKTLESANSKLP